MLNFRKICRVMFLAAFACTLAGSAMAQALSRGNSDNSYILPSGYGITTKVTKEGITTKNNLAECQKHCQLPAKCIETNGTFTCASSDKPGKDDTAAPDKVIGTNVEQSASSVTGCSSNYGLFSGLIETGRKIFNGLRDLIYVVAGFGIIGVAVGGFFGNLNWKWLGAIVIALVVIATTGEIINMITGCDKFTAAMISDTLK